MSLAKYVSSTKEKNAIFSASTPTSVTFISGSSVFKKSDTI